MSQSFLIILDKEHKQQCIQFNRALYYRYNTNAITVSAYNDTDIFPQCAGEFVRPSISNIIKGANWEIKTIKKGQTLILAILGQLSKDIMLQLLKAFQATKKKIKLVCIGTSEDTFKDFTNLNIPTIVISGKPEILLPIFDGKIINPEKLSQIPGIKVESNAIATLEEDILTPQPEPWCY